VLRLWVVVEPQVETTLVAVAVAAKFFIAKHFQSRLMNHSQLGLVLAVQ
jgi:hypothetical protein